jgi:predicted transposase YbfD/YdcC
VLGQTTVDSKTNEIIAIPELLTMLDIENSIITLDDMGCQQEIAKQIIKHKADYILPLKSNHCVMNQEYVRSKGHLFLTS